MLNPMPADLIVDEENRPYFMRDLTLDRFFKGLGDANGRAYLLGQLLRNARPDDVFSFVSPGELLRAWPEIEEYLGRRWAFWHWLLTTWEDQGLVWR